MTPQHMVALASGQRKRLGVAALCRDIRPLSRRDAAMMVASLIERDYDDPIIGSARVGLLLRAIPQLGETKMTRCLLAAKVINADKHLRDLTERQRGAIVIQLELWADGCFQFGERT